MQTGQQYRTADQVHTIINTTPRPISIFGANGLEDFEQYDTIVGGVYAALEFPNDDAELIGTATPAELDLLIVQAEAARTAVEAERIAQADEYRRAQDAAQAAVDAAMPPGTKALIVATLQERDVDIMTDYFGTIKKRRVVIGFSASTRVNVAELQRHARAFEPAASIADQAHRDAGRSPWVGVDTYQTGWQVHKEKGLRVNERTECEPVSTNKTTQATTTQTAPAAGVAYEAQDRTHTKTGRLLFLAVPVERQERDTFNAERQRAKAAGGYYSRAWAGTPGGFAFETDAARAAFMQSDTTSTTSTTPTTPSPSTLTTTTGQAKAERLHELADSMQAAIDAKLGDRLTNTPKRQAQAARARSEGQRLQRAQALLRAIADADSHPVLLAGITSKKTAIDAVPARMEYTTNGYHSYSLDTNTPPDELTPTQAAAWALLQPDPSQAEAFKREQNRQRLIGNQDYYPTPPDLVEGLLELAPADAQRVLEPSAGDGAILRALREVYSNVTGIELQPDLAALADCECGDFLEHQGRYDLIVTNPPFSMRTGDRHLEHMKQLLAPGGVLLAVVPETVANRQGLEVLTPPGEHFKPHTSVSTVIARWAV